jgi:hypothetical protein
MDGDWWKQYLVEARATFLGARFTVNNIGKVHGVKVMAKPFTAFGNSGSGAINLAYAAGAKKIILLGYDCQHTDGKRHWHGNHPKGMGNADVFAKWPAQFKRLADHLKGVNVVNCTRQTALDVFPKKRLEAVL